MYKHEHIDEDIILLSAFFPTFILHGTLSLMSCTVCVVADIRSVAQRYLSMPRLVAVRSPSLRKIQKCGHEMSQPQGKTLS